jgi:hypothetical protein
MVRCWLSRQERYSGGRSTYYYSGAQENIFSQLFRQFRMLNCNLSHSLKNLPTLFQKWFEYFHQKKSEQGVYVLPCNSLWQQLKKMHCINEKYTVGNDLNCHIIVTVKMNIFPKRSKASISKQTNQHILKAFNKIKQITHGGR